MQKKIQLSFILGALLSSLSANEVKIKPLTITSTAITTDELQSTDAVEVYTQKDIEESHVQNVYEFLNTHTSLFSTSAYGNPFIQKLDMRGYGVGDGYQNIVITVNGRKMNNIDMVAPLLASISPNSIASIEIIKSSGIVIGGDGANAGAINIVTKKSNEQSLSIYGGSYGSFDTAFYSGYSDEKLSVSLNGEMQKNNGIRHIGTDGNKDENKFSTFSFNLAYQLHKDLQIHTDVSTTHTNVTYASPLTQEQYKSNPTQQGNSVTQQRYNSNTLALGATYYINDNLIFNANVTKEKKKSKYNYITYSFRSLTDYDYESAKLNIDYENKNMSFKVGYDFFDSQRDTATNSVTKKANAIYGISEYRLHSYTYKIGLRYEKIHFNSIGGENQDDKLWGAELGINKTLSSTSSLFANYSHSYQSADLDRLFSYSTGAFNGYVEPSVANNFSLGYSHITNNNKFKASLFYADLENEIFYYSDPTYVSSRNTNIDKSHKYGLDIYNKWIISNQSNLTLNYNYVQAIIDKEVENGNDYANNNLPGVSNHNLKATFKYLVDSFTTLALTHTYRSSAYAANDFQNNFSQKQDAYNATDISYTYETKEYEFFAKINNLLNQKNGLWIQDDSIYPVNFTTTALAGLKLKF